jgi:hypothetical protein
LDHLRHQIALELAHHASDDLGYEFALGHEAFQRFITVRRHCILHSLLHCILPSRFGGFAALLELFSGASGPFGLPMSSVGTKWT